MLPLVRPVARVKSEMEVPAYPFLLKMDAVCSIINLRVFQERIILQIYQLVYEIQNKGQIFKYTKSEANLVFIQASC